MSASKGHPLPGELAFAILQKNAGIRAHVPFEPTNHIFSLSCVSPPPGVTIDAVSEIFQEFARKTGTGILCSYNGNIVTGKIEPVEINVPTLFANLRKGGTYIVPTMYGTGLIKRKKEGGVTAPSILLPGAVIALIAEKMHPVVVCNSQTKPAKADAQWYMSIITFYPGMLVTYRLIGLYMPGLVVELRVKKDEKGDTLVKFGILRVDGVYRRVISDDERAMVETSRVDETLFFLDEKASLFNAISLRDGTLLESIAAERKHGIPVLWDGVVKIASLESYIKHFDIEEAAAELLRTLMLADANGEE